MGNLIAGCFSLLLGIVGLYTGIMQFRNRVLFGRWKTTTGRVIERGTYVPRVGSSSAPAFRHSPLVRYRYQVAGQEFVGDAIYPVRMQLPPRGRRRWAEKKAASFPDEVLVHYNPEDAKESYLILTSRSVLAIVLISGVFACLLGLAFLLIFK